jgi:hypothetical protein
MWYVPLQWKAYQKAQVFEKDSTIVCVDGDNFLFDLQCKISRNKGDSMDQLWICGKLIAKVEFSERSEASER